MAITISIINLKGGVGKSTLAMIIAEYLSLHFRYNKRVLLIDMDAQANLSYIMVPTRWIQSQTENKRTIYHFFESVISGKPAPLIDFIASPPLIVSNVRRQYNVENNRSKETLDMIISTPQVAQLDEKLLELWEHNQPMPKNLRSSLKKSMEQLQDKYDVILIDCPPGLSLFSSTALIASDFFISPIIPEPLSLEGVRLVQDRARELSRFPDCNVEFAGAVLNIVKYYRRTHDLTSVEIFGNRRGELNPFLYWIPDNERIRKLGEFEIDPANIKDGWAAGVDTKFYTVTSKYSVSYPLNNPVQGALAYIRDYEGEKYKINERFERLVDEICERTGI